MNTPRTNRLPSASDVTRSLIETALTVMFRRKQLILTLFIAVFGGVATATKMLPDEYESEMKILVKNERADMVVAPAASAAGAIIRGNVDETVINSELELLSSTDLLKQVVLSLKLYDQGTLDTPPAAAVERGIRGLRSGLTIIPVRKSNIIQVSYASRTPESAAAVLEALASAYLEAHLRLHRSTGASEFFSQQKARYQTQLQNAEANLQTFQTTSRVYLMPQQKETTLRKLMDTQTLLHETEAALSEANARVDALNAQIATSTPRIVTQSRSIPNQASIERLTTMLAELRNRRSQLTLKFLPGDRLVREVDEEIENTRVALDRAERVNAVEDITDLNPTWQAMQVDLATGRATKAAMEARRNALATVVDTHRAELVELQAATNQFDDLQRVLKETEESYLLYARKEEEARIADLLDQQKISNVALAEQPTVSPIPSGPNTVLNLGLGLVLATCVAVGAAVAVEVVTSSTLHTPAEVEAATGLPVLGAIPLEPA
jgi:uncharacterized protein involved in exopolysaccharide biosynthesis